MINIFTNWFNFFFKYSNNVGTRTIFFLLIQLSSLLLSTHTKYLIKKKRLLKLYRMPNNFR